MPDEIYYNPGDVAEEHGVLWRLYPTEDNPNPGLRLWGSWHPHIADALGDLEAARKNPRCEYAALYTRSITLWQRTSNAVGRRCADVGQVHQAEHNGELV